MDIAKKYGLHVKMKNAEDLKIGDLIRGREISGKFDVVVLPIVQIISLNRIIEASLVNGYTAFIEEGGRVEVFSISLLDVSKTCQHSNESR